MALMTMRAVPKTIAGRQRALAVKGNNRFARFANLTGAEVLGKIQNAQLRLAVKAQSMFDISGLQPAYAFAGVNGERALEKQVEAPNMYMSADQVAGTGVAKGAENTTKDQEIADFGRFRCALEIKEKASRNQSIALKASFITVGIWGLITSVDWICNSTPSLATTLVSLGAIVGCSIMGWNSISGKALNTAGNQILADFKTRYQNKEIPSVWDVIDAPAGKELRAFLKEDVN